MSAREDGKRMAILMRYEQVANTYGGGGLKTVAREFNLTPERIRRVVQLEHRIATSGDRAEIKATLPKEIRRKL